MSAININPWIPEEWDSDVVQRVNQVSVVETTFRRVPMNHVTIHEPRSAGASVGTVAKSSAYSEDGSTNDKVDLTAVKIGQVFRIAYEDISDDITGVIAVKQRDWATSYAKFIDNACLGTSGASDGAATPYTSLYKALRTNDTGAPYTADANYKSASNATLTSSASYAQLDGLLKLVESSDYFDEGSMVVIAHPTFKSVLRNVVDAQGRPIFIGGQGGDRATPDTVFGYPIRWSLGAKRTGPATAAPASTDHALMFIGNPDYAFLGVRSGPETQTQTADTGAAFLTDEALIKMRARRGYVTAQPLAWAVLENTG